jgi:hypothetical protein
VIKLYLEIRQTYNAAGEMCGSSFINERFQALLIRKLRSATYLEQNGQTISKIIDGLVVEFERHYKQKFDRMLLDPSNVYEVRIPGLRENDKPRFVYGAMRLSWYVRN